MMDYKTLTEVAEKLRVNNPVVSRFNCEKQTADWLDNTFNINKLLSKPDVIAGFYGYPSGFFGVPVVVVEHLAPGFIEAEMTDGTRQIISLRKKSDDSKGGQS